MKITETSTPHERYLEELRVSGMSKVGESEIDRVKAWSRANGKTAVDLLQISGVTREAGTEMGKEKYVHLLCEKLGI